jgi:exodeoxyribonuclease VII large subunit
MPHIFRVAELSRALKDVVEGQFPFIWVRGQVSNLSRPSSGHIYFTLKDEQSVLGVVWFRGSQNGLSLGNGESYDPLTGEVVEAGGSAWLADGAEVLCAGKLTVYGPRGVYQLVAELVQDQGLGRLYLEFEALKARLAEKGFFALERKRPLPVLPRAVSVITAPGGAAIRDFLRVARERGLGCQVRLHPVLVQGEAAPAQIAQAIKAVGESGWAEVAVLIRGGGSIEDLWAFNSLDVVQAIFDCPVPVLCGVGHEVDTTIADLVADVRAATPSHAAQILWPQREVLAQGVDEAETGLRAAFGRFTRAKEQGLEVLEKALAWLSPMASIKRLDEGLAGLEARLLGAGRNLPLAREQALEGLAGRLAWQGGVWLDGRDRELVGLGQRLGAAGARAVAERENALALLVAGLAGLDPHGPLRRGYVLARKPDGGFLRRIGEVSPGEALDIVAQDGTVQTVVTGSRPEPLSPQEVS